MRAKIYIPEILIGVFLTIAIFAMGFWSASTWTPSPYRQTNQTTRDEASKAQPDKTFWERTTDDPVALFTFWITIFTGVSVVSNIGLWLVTRSTLNHGRDASQRELRAYLTVVEGQTPAYRVRAVSGMKLLTMSEAERFDFSIAPPSEVLVSNTIGAHQSKFINVILDRALSKSELREYIKGTKSLFIYGTIRYRDAFDRPRYTNFCFSVANWNKRGAPLWHMANRHNDSN